MDAKSHNLKMYPSHYSASLSGMNLSLTIDKKVQDVIERELNNAYDIYHPDGIWALAMNPQNGEILGMSSKPDFNPNDIKTKILPFIIKTFLFGKPMNQVPLLKLLLFLVHLMKISLIWIKIRILIKDMNMFQELALNHGKKEDTVYKPFVKYSKIHPIPALLKLGVVLEKKEFIIM